LNRVSNTSRNLSVAWLKNNPAIPAIELRALLLCTEVAERCFRDWHNRTSPLGEVPDQPTLADKSLVTTSVELSKILGLVG
jgi:hypothetical protein